MNTDGADQSEHFLESNAFHVCVCPRRIHSTLSSGENAMTSFPSVGYLLWAPRGLHHRAGEMFPPLQLVVFHWPSPWIPVLDA